MLCQPFFKLSTFGYSVAFGMFKTVGTDTHRSARLLHNQMLESVIRLPQCFFDTTPLGRVLNRFSKDQYTVDEVLPRSFNGYFRTLFQVLSVLAVNSYGSPWYSVLALPLSVLYAYFQKFYLSTSRELKRLV